jgi:Tripartite tricarboxylate transporter TctB family
MTNKNDSSETSEVQRKGVATYKVEAVVAFLILIFGITVAAGSWKLGAGWTTDGPGAGYFPFYIGILLCISGLGVMYQSLFGKDKNTDIFVDEVQLKRVLSILVPACVYVLGVQFLGLYVASAIYIGLFMRILGKFSVLKSVITSLAVIVLFFFMFEVWFKVPLFKGSLDPLAFLGY